MKAFIPVAVLLLFLMFGLYKIGQPETYGLTTDLFQDQPSPAIEQMDTSPPSRPRSEQPNIIVILADDLGYGDSGVYGNKLIKTPNLDELAQQGMTFTNAYSSAALCSPSRAGLLTGRYPLRSGIVQPVQAAGDSLERKMSYQLGLAISNLASVDMLGGSNMSNGLPRSEITIAENLKAAGYTSGIYGKWHLGDFTEWPEYHPYQHGFDDFVGFNMSNDDWPVAYYRGGEQLIEDIGLDQTEYTATFTQEAIRFINESKDKPFFVYLSHKDPHQPFYPSKAFAGTSDAGPYGDAVSEFDWSIGEIQKTLRELGLDKNTLIIVTSDNGPWYEGSPGNLRGRKGQSYEGGFRVPLVVSLPNRIAPGSKSAIPVMNFDFFATFAQLAGAALPKDRIIDGQDLSPILMPSELSEAAVVSLAERPLYFFHDYDVEAVRIGDWKLLNSVSHYVWPAPLDKQDTLVGRATSSRNYTPPNSDQSVPTLGRWPLLYRLDRDPGESYNLADKFPEKTQAMKKQLEDWRAEFHANPRKIEPSHNSAG